MFQYLKKTLAFPATMKYNLFMCDGFSMNNCIKSFERSFSNTLMLAHTLKTFRGSASTKVLGLFHCGRVGTYLYGMQQKPCLRCLTDFHLKQKNDFRQQVLAMCAPISSDLPRCESNVAREHQSRTASHSVITMSKVLNLMHSENHAKQPLWNYEYPALCASMTLQSLN